MLPSELNFFYQCRGPLTLQQRQVRYTVLLTGEKVKKGILIQADVSDLIC